MQQIDHLLHGHALTDDVRLDLISQIGFHQLFTSIFRVIGFLIGDPGAFASEKSAVPQIRSDFRP